MATSMALAGTIGLTNTSSPIIGGVSIGNLTPSHTGIKYCTTGAGSATSSIHSPISTTSSTPNSTIIINNNNSTTTSGSLVKCPGSGSMNGGGGHNSNLSTIGNDSNSSSSDIFGSKCKRKINFSNLGMPGRAHQPATVARRNARERNRVKQVNNGFAALKQHIPIGHRSKKMSKVETLRCAVDYIRNLQGMLDIQGLGSSSPAGSSVSGDIILMDDDENLEQQPTHHQELGHQQHQQMNGVNNQRDAYAMSSSSSSSPTSSDFGASVAHLQHHLSLLQSHPSLQHQQHLANNNNSNNNNNHHHHQQHRHLSLSHHHLHGTNGVSVATQLSPTSSEDPSSPYTSETSSYVTTNANIKAETILPYDYENYEPVSPEDEELLDAIAFWQQS